MKRLSLEELEGLRKLYKLITEKKLGDDLIQERVEIIRYLEQKTGQDFRDTNDFKKKMECYFIGQNKMRGADLRKLRKKKGWTQKVMAEYLNVSRIYLAKMESGGRPLNRGAVNFLHGVATQVLET